LSLHAQDTSTVIGTNSFLEVTEQGVYFATYDGTICGKNASSYFIVTNCNATFNEVTLNVQDNIDLSTGATINWTAYDLSTDAFITWNPVGGSSTDPMIIATEIPIRYTATITKANNDSQLPSFTVVCIFEAAILVDDIATTDEDVSVVIDIYANDSELPTTGSLTTTDPANGTVVIDNNGTPNNPLDDIVNYIPDPDYNGPDTFDYTVCNTFGDCSTATVNIDVLPIVDAIDDFVATEEDTPLDIDILANDNDLPTVGTLITTNPSSGSVIVDDNGTPNNPIDDTVNYTPNTGFVGVDTFDYTVCDDRYCR